MSSALQGIEMTEFRPHQNGASSLYKCVLLLYLKYFTSAERAGEALLPKHALSYLLKLA